MHEYAQKVLQRSQLASLGSYPEIETLDDYTQATRLYVFECFVHNALYDFTCACPQSDEIYIPGIREYHTAFTAMFSKIRKWKDKNLELVSMLEYDTEFFAFHMFFVDYIRRKYGLSHDTGYFHKADQDKRLRSKFLSLCDRMSIDDDKHLEAIQHAHALLFDAIPGWRQYTMLDAILKQSSLSNGIDPRYRVFFRSRAQLETYAEYKRGCELFIKEALVYRDLCSYTDPMRDACSVTVPMLKPIRPEPLPDVRDFMDRLERLIFTLESCQCNEFKVWRASGLPQDWLMASHEEFVDLLYVFGSYFQYINYPSDQNLVEKLDAYIYTQAEHQVKALLL